MKKYVQFTLPPYLLQTIFFSVIYALHANVGYDLNEFFMELDGVKNSNINILKNIFLC